VKTTPDIIVIGSGHNGLVAACYLQQAGLDVLVLEANDWIGGCTSTSAIIPEAPDHLISPCAADFCLIRAATIVDDLQLRRHGYVEIEVDPPYVAPTPDGASLAFWRDPHRTAQEIKRFSQRDARAYLKYAELLDSALDAGLGYILNNATRPGFDAVAQATRVGLRHPRHLASLLPLVMGSAAEAIDERFRHPIVRGGLASMSAIGAPITHKGSGINALFPGIVSRIGVSRAVGGSQALPDSLVRCLVDLDGHVRTGARVQDLLVTGDRVTGVRLTGGEELHARAVVAGCDPMQTLGRMLPDGMLPDRIARRVRDIPSTNGGNAYFKVDMAFSGQLRTDRLDAWRGDGLDLRRTALLAGSFEEMCEAVDRSSSGLLPQPFPFAALTPTGVDDSLAPAGMETLYLWVGWAPRDPAGGWTDALAHEAATSLIEHASLYYENIKDIEIGRYVEPWPLLAQRTNTPDGNPYHVDLLFSRNGPLRPAFGLGGYTTPVPGLYLTGAGTHPGPAVSGIPGQLAARTVLRTLRDLDGGGARATAAQDRRAAAQEPRQPVSAP
jgi:phytoene dehydrogenase-like protein